MNDADKSGPDAPPMSDARPTSDARPPSDAPPMSDPRPVDAQPFGAAQPFAEAQSGNDAQPVNDLASTVPLMTLSLLDWIALIILIAGGLNWGLVGLLNLDLIGAALGEASAASRLARIVIGLAALYGIAFAWRLGGRRR